MPKDGELPPVTQLDDYRARHSDPQLPALNDILTTGSTDEVIATAAQFGLKELEEPGRNPLKMGQQAAHALLMYLNIVDAPSSLMQGPGKFHPDAPRERIERLREIDAHLRYATDALTRWVEADNPRHDTYKEHMAEINEWISRYVATGTCPPLPQLDIVRAAHELRASVPFNPSAKHAYNILLLLIEDHCLANSPELD